jgi:hypothetical protein
MGLQRESGFRVSEISILTKKIGDLESIQKPPRQLSTSVYELHREPLGVDGLEECRRILTSSGLKRAATIHR